MESIINGLCLINMKPEIRSCCCSCMVLEICLPWPKGSSSPTWQLCCCFYPNSGVCPTVGYETSLSSFRSRKFQHRFKPGSGHELIHNPSAKKLKSVSNHHHFRKCADSFVPHIFVWGSCFWFCIPPSVLLPPSSSRPTQLVHTQLVSHTTCSLNLLTHNLSTHKLAHTQLVHTQLAHTQLVITQLAHTKLAHTQLAHTQLSHTTCHTQLVHTQLAHTQLTPHTTCSHTTCPHTTCSHTTCHHTTCPHTTCSHTTYSHTQLAHTQLVLTQLVHHTTCSHATYSHTTCPRTTYSITQLTHTQLAWHCNVITYTFTGHGSGGAHGLPTWQLARTASCVAGVALDIHRQLCMAGTQLTSLGNLLWSRTTWSHTTYSHTTCVALGDIRTFTLRGTTCPLTATLRGRRGNLLTSTVTLRGRRGNLSTCIFTWSTHNLSTHNVSGVATCGTGPTLVHTQLVPHMNLRGHTCALCAVGVALGHIHLHFVWQAWHLVTSAITLHGRRGTCPHVSSLGDIDAHFAWQAWHLRHWAGSGGAPGSNDATNGASGRTAHVFGCFSVCVQMPQHPLPFPWLIRCKCFRFILTKLSKTQRKCHLLRTWCNERSLGQTAHVFGYFSVCVQMLQHPLPFPWLIRCKCFRFILTAGPGLLADL